MTFSLISVLEMVFMSTKENQAIDCKYVSLQFLQLGEFTCKFWKVFLSQIHAIGLQYLVFSQTRCTFQLDVADKNENDKRSGVDLLLVGSFQAFGEVSNGK